MSGPWPAPFVGAHLLLTEPGQINGSWDTWPSEWNIIRFDAIDVLFISPFRVMITDFSFNLMEVDGGSLATRFDMVIRAARTKNPSIKIILEQFYTANEPEQNDFYILSTEDARKAYAKSVAGFIESYYSKEFEAPSDATALVSGRINGWDVDIEGSTEVTYLTGILTEVRNSFDKLSRKLNSDEKLSVSICPAWTTGLDKQTGSVVNYCNMQNYSGGINTTPSEYETAGNLSPAQLAWGLCSEEPYNSEQSCLDFSGVKIKAEGARDKKTGIWAWRVNSDNRLFENVLQV